MTTLQPVSLSMKRRSQCVEVVLNCRKRAVALLYASRVVIACRALDCCLGLPSGLYEPKQLEDS